MSYQSANKSSEMLGLNQKSKLDCFQTHSMENIKTGSECEFIPGGLGLCSGLGLVNI